MKILLLWSFGRDILFHKMIILYNEMERYWKLLNETES